MISSARETTNEPLTEIKLSVVIPTFNDEFAVEKTLDALSRLVNVDEIIVVDGGSTDKTVSLIETYAAANKPLKLIKIAEANRGRQLHEGTLHATGEIFWFLHADTRPVQGCGRQIKQYMRYREIVGGNFKIVFEGDNRTARFFTWIYPHLRSLNLIYGDSAMFVHRASYEKTGGFKPLPIFHDIDLYKRLAKAGQFVHVNLPVTVSAERFQNRPFFKTFLHWSILQTLYWLGVPPRFLARGYKRIEEQKAELQK